MKKERSSSLRCALLVPLALFLASLVTSCLAYSNAKRNIAVDLNDAMLALANENSELWTRQDTVAALRQMHLATHKPIIYQASDVNFRNSVLKDEAYFTLTLVDSKNCAPVMRANSQGVRHTASHFASDSIMLVPSRASDGIAIQLRGFADCSMASVFEVSDQTLPGLLFMLSLMSMTGMVLWHRPKAQPAVNILDGVRLTPMQRRFALMLLEAPDMKVDKATLCEVLWDNKMNAEESLYTLVRRTKAALAPTGIEIACNRGDSYELRINR